MFLRRRFKNPRAPISVGMVFVALGALSLRFLHPGPHLPPNLADGMSGFCYGLGLACMLVGLLAVRRGRPQCAADAESRDIH